MSVPRADPLDQKPLEREQPELNLGFRCWGSPFDEEGALFGKPTDEVSVIGIRTK